MTKAIGIRKRCVNRAGERFLAKKIIYIKETNPYFMFFKTSPAYKVVKESSK